MGNAAGFKKKWRNDGYDRWDDKAALDLKGHIYECIQDLQSLHEIEILLCGGAGEGKSSLINNCMASITGSFAVVAVHGAGDFQVTKRYNRFQAWMKQGNDTRNLPLMFSDTRGFSESKENGAPVEAIKACILGKVRPNELIDPNVSDDDWRRKPTVKCKASYVFLVADANIFPNDDEIEAARAKKVYQNLSEIREFSQREGLNVAAFLTMSDKLDPTIKSDVTNLHCSTAVEKKVKAFHKMISIPENRIFPIMNYTGEIRTTSEMAIQTLIALRGCLQDIRSAYWAGPK